MGQSNNFAMQTGKETGFPPAVHLVT